MAIIRDSHAKEVFKTPSNAKFITQVLENQLKFEDSKRNPISADMIPGESLIMNLIDSSSNAMLKFLDSEEIDTCDLINLKQVKDLKEELKSIPRGELVFSSGSAGFEKYSNLLDILRKTLPSAL
mmetsp:Transcript_16427/g.14107  ORF Transcript_16427/g.14107 Transcript_16427/m.14107 type:complete len:125 (-) Transcript_16427:851-1225(-)